MDIEKLSKKAFGRFKARFLSYVIVSILGWALAFALVLVGFVVGGAVFLVWLATKSAVLTGVLGAAAGLVFIGALIYVSSWIQLTMIAVLTQEKKLSPVDTYKKVKPLVGGYVYFAVVLMLFFLGLLPFTVASLLIVGLLWGLWGIFSVFVYLEKRKKGLDNLWISRDIVNQKFWPIAGVVALVVIVVVVISSVLTSTKAGFLTSLIMQFIVSPFVTSFYFEMYKDLKVPAKAKSSKVWIALSVVGFVALIVIVAASVAVIGQIGSDLMKQGVQQDQIYRELQYPSPAQSS